MNSSSKKKGVSIFKIFGILLLIIVIPIVSLITYTSFKNKTLFNETYGTKLLDNKISAKDFFSEYNNQLSNSSLPIIKDSKIKYKETSELSYQIAEISDLSIDDYHIYASWKPEATKSLPQSNVYMKIDVYSKVIDYQNFCYGYISEDYDLAVLKSMRNVLINNGYECISEEDITSFYYSILNDESLYGQIIPLKVSEGFIITVSYNRYAVTLALDTNTYS